MSLIKKVRTKVRYKKILKLKQNVQNNPKFLNFKTKKWQNIILQNKKKITNSHKLNNLDQFNYFIPKFTDFFAKKFKLTLQSKQKVSYLYGYLTKKYLKKIIGKALTKENSSYWILKNLEMRLDSVLYQSHFVKSFREARQLISHGHVFVNQTKIKTPSFFLVGGDIISISKNIKPKLEKKILKSRLLPLPPKYLQINYKILSILYLGNIEKSNLFNQFTFWLDIKTVIEFYKNK